MFKSGLLVNEAVKPIDFCRSLRAHYGANVFKKGCTSVDDDLGPRSFGATPDP